MNWSKGLSAAYRAYIIDPATWREKEVFEITGGTINRDNTGLRDSADIDTARFRLDKECYIRIYMDTEQSGGREHTPLFTGLACNPEIERDGVLETNTLECYSVLKAAQDSLLSPGYWVPQGKSGAEIVKELFDIIPAPVRIDGEAPSLQSYIIAEGGETRLSMAERVLEAINWTMRIEGTGEVVLCPYPVTIDATFDALDNDCIETAIKISFDWYSAPNVFRATSDDSMAVARDDSPDSMLSTVNRGREVWAEDDSPDLNTGESLTEYAARRLKELQQVALTASYDRRYHPNVFVNSVIRLHYPEQDLDGLYRVKSQKIELGYAARTSEEVEKL